jgi:hypothetical protein
MSKYEYTLTTLMVSPCIQLVSKHKKLENCYTEIRKNLDAKFYGGLDAMLLWDEHSFDLLTVGVEISLTHVNYGEKLDEAIDRLAKLCDNHNCVIRIGGEVVKCS